MFDTRGMCICQHATILERSGARQQALGPISECPCAGTRILPRASVVDFRNQVAAQLGAQRVWTESDSEFEVRTSRYELPSGALWYIQNCAPLTLECGEAPLVRVQIQRGGSGITTINSQACQYIRHAVVHLSCSGNTRIRRGLPPRCLARSHGCSRCASWWPSPAPGDPAADF